MAFQKKRQWPYALAFLLLAGLLLHLAGAVLRPAQNTYGSTWRAFLAEPENSMDVLYLGSSFAYCDFNPGLIYGASGLTGYVMGGPEQTLSITYWYLRQALETQSPSTVVLEASGLWFDRYQAYTQTNVGTMPLSLSKLGAAFTAAPPEQRLGLLWDLYVFHDRWKQLTPGDFAKALRPARTDHYKGYTPVEGAEHAPTGAPVPSGNWKPEETYRENLTWLGKIADLCADREIRLLVVFNPTYGQHLPEEYARMAGDVEALGEHVSFYNWSNSFEAMGLTPAVHLYDGGHLNRDGAALFSRWVGAFLRDEIGLTPRPQTPENAAAWADAQARWS